MEAEFSTTISVFIFEIENGLSGKENVLPCVPVRLEVVILIHLKRRVSAS